ncbi:MAG: CDP-alcohol phosphatidyltransferase family protein [Vicingaceae bacterium]
MLNSFKLSRLNIADWISVSRVIFSSLLIGLIVNDYRTIFQWVLLVALFTDALDGFIAHRLKIVSPHGAALDSFADAYLFLVCVGAVIYFETDFIINHINFIVPAMGIYIIQLSLAYFKYGKPSSFHTYLAKTAALIQGSFFLVLFFYEAVEWLFYLTIAISLLETVEEITLIFILPKWKADVKGIFWLPTKNKLSKRYLDEK